MHNLNKAPKLFAILILIHTAFCNSERQGHRGELISENISISEAMYIRYKGNSNELSKIQSNEIRNLACYISPMPGRLIGGPTGVKIRQFSITDNKVQINLAAADAKKLTEKRQLARNNEPLLIVKPAETQFARLATSCNDWGTGFASRYGNNLMLVYFDRAATLTGKVGDDEGQDEIQLSIPRPGFYFVERYVETLNAVKLRLFSGNNKDIVWTLIRQN